MFILTKKSNGLAFEFSLLSLMIFYSIILNLNSGIVEIDSTNLHLSGLKYIGSGLKNKSQIYSIIKNIFFIHLFYLFEGFQRLALLYELHLSQELF